MNIIKAFSPISLFFGGMFGANGTFWGTLDMGGSLKKKIKRLSPKKQKQKTPYNKRRAT